MLSSELQEALDDPGFIESLTGMGSQQSEVACLESYQAVNVLFRCRHLSPPFFRTDFLGAVFSDVISGLTLSICRLRSTAPVV